MRYLITGSAGFIGTNLSKFLLELGEFVIGIDNYDSGTVENTNMLLEKYTNFTFIEKDICDITSDTFEKIDVVINLACPASPPFYQSNPIHTTETCIIGVLNMLRLAQRHNAIFVQSSTSEVYGDPKESPQVETYRGNVNTVGIRSCYDEGKRCAESIIMDFHRIYGLKVKIMRIFNTYGPYMRVDDGRVISNFINQALSGEDITVYGDGSQTRSYQYVDDLIYAINKLVKTPDEVTGPVNIGNPGEITVLETAERIKDLMNYDGKIVFKKLPSDDPMRRMPDITLAKKLLDWEPKVSVDEGFRKTIEYFKNKFDGK